MTSQTAPNKPRILITAQEGLGDSPLHTHLLTLGYTVCGQAATIRQTLDLAESEQPDLVIIDTFPPKDIDGVYVGEVLKSRWNIPVLRVTSESEVEPNSYSQYSGYLVEPFSERDVALAVETALFRAKVDSEREQMEEKLTVYENLLDLTDEMMSVVDQCFCIQTVNQKFLSLVDASSTQAIGRPLAEILGQELFEESLKPRLSRCFDGEQSQFQMKWPYPAGDRTLLVRCVPSHNRGGGIDHAAVLILDTSETVPARLEPDDNYTALEKSESRYRFFFKESPDGVVIINAQTGRIEEFNDQVCRQLGYSPEEFSQLNIWDIYELESKEDTLSHIERTYCNELNEFETHQRTKTGEIRTVKVTAKIFRIGDEVFHHAIWRDITDKKRAEEALRRSEEKFSNLFQLSPSWLTVSSLDDGSFLEVNDAFLRDSGWQREEIVGRGFQETGFWPFPEQRRQALEIVKREGRLRNFEALVRLKSGLRHILWSAEPFDDKGQKRLMNVAVDITEHKQAVDMLRRSEERKTLFTQIASIFLTIPDEDMYAEVLSLILQAMNSEYGIFGYIGENGDLIVPSLSRDVWKQCQVPEKSIVFPRNTWGDSLWGRSIREQKGFHAEAPFKTPGGHISIRNFMTHPVVFRDLSVGLICVANKSSPYTDDDMELMSEIIDYISPILNARLQRDIQESKRLEVEQALLARERELTTLMENLPDLIARFDRDGCFLYASPAQARASRKPQEWFIGKNIVSTTKNDQVMGEQLLSQIRQAWDQKISNTYEAIWQFGPENRFFEVQHIPELDASGEVVSVLGIAREITARKKADDDRARLEAQLRQSQKLEAIGALAGGISHDFNNLLQAILGYTELLLTGKDEKHQDFYKLKSVHETAERAAHLVHQLLLFSRKTDTKREPVDLNLEIQKAAKLLERTIPKMVDIEVQPGDRLWSTLAEPVQIQQVLLNLGTNAADAMAGVGKLVIRTENVSLDEEYAVRYLGVQPGKYILLTVIDSGKGMDKETLKHIFEPFFTTKGTGKGTGLGLASVFGIVKNHGGHITCYSEIGCGTEFKIYLPASEQSLTHDPGQFVAEPITGGSETILLVDDEEFIRELTQEALMMFSYTVLTAASGEEALEVYTKAPGEIDLVLMDLGMPGMGGFKCLQEILRLDSSAKVIIASGYSLDGQIQKSIDVGAIGYIGKPYQINKLLKKVREALEVISE